MNKMLMCLFMIGLSATAIAQKPDYKRPAALGVSFILNDYTTAQRIRTSSFNYVVNNKQNAKFKEMSPGIALTYFQGINNHVDFAGTLGGSFVKITPDNTTNASVSERFLLEGDASVNLKLFSDRYIFTPYAIAGVGASHYNKKFDAFLPLGLGVKANIFNEAAIFLTGQYRVPVTNQTNNYHFQYGLGFAGIIGGKK